MIFKYLSISHNLITEVVFRIIGLTEMFVFEKKEMSIRVGPVEFD